MARSKIEKAVKGKTSNGNGRTKKNILNYNDEIISVPSTTIAIKKEKLHLPRSFSIHAKEKKTNKIDNLHEVYK